MKGLRFIVGNKKSLNLIEKVKALITAEAKAGNMLDKQISELEDEVESGNAVIALFDDQVIGYGALGFWPNLVEIRSIVIQSEYRQRGFGSRLIKKMIALAKKKYPDLQVIAIAGPMSKNIFITVGMEAIPKRCLSNQLWEICPDCQDFDKFPACHCTALVSKDKRVKYRIGILNPESSNLIESTAELYCQIWKEPPWNEDLWRTQEVISDILEQLALPKARGLVAIVGKKVKSFTWGYEVDKKMLAKIAGHSKLSRLFSGGKRIFYIDELGTAKNYRQYGIAESISKQLLSFAEMAGLDLVVLRTDVQARAARSLYEKLGFQELSILDRKYPDRSYWVLNLKP